MEYCPHGNFCDLITDKILPNDDKLIRTYFDQLIDGVDFLHSKNISHMDLKLDNLLLSETYRLKICDFDCSLVENPDMEKVDVKEEYEGSKDYRAPEVLKHDVKNGRAVDIYSCGIILFCMYLKNFPYFEDEEIHGYNLYKMLMDKDPDYWKAIKEIYGNGDPNWDIDPAFKDLFMKMVEPDPEQRATLDDIKDHPWFRRVTYNYVEMQLIMEHILTKAREDRVPSSNKKK